MSQSKMTTSKQTPFSLLNFVLSGVLLLGSMLASTDSIQAADTSAITPPNAEFFTDIYVDIWDVKIFRIDENEEIFEVEATLDAAWSDPRLQFDAAAVGNDTKVYEGETAAEALKNEIWWPNFDVADSRGNRDIINLSISVDSEGEVYYRERFTAVIMQPYDLEYFPFDVQNISFKIVPFSAAFSENINFVSFSDLDNDTSSWNPDEWDISNLQLTITSGHCPELESISEPTRECENGDFVFTALDSAATVSMTISRVPDHYMSNYVLPILLIVMISTAVFFMGFERMHLGDRLSVSFTSVLTIVAFDFVASENLPKLWYSTGIDHILTAAYVFLALNVLENVVVSRINVSRQVAAMRIDTTFRWVYPIAFFLVVFYIIGSLLPEVG